MGKRRGEEVDALVETIAKGNACEGGRERIHSFVEVFAEADRSERGRKFVDVRVESVTS